MEMPLIPALTGQAEEGTDETPPVEDLIAALSDEDIAQLDKEAADWAASGTAEVATDAPVDDEEAADGEADETVADEAAETDDEQAAEQDAGTEQHSPRDMLEAARQAKYSIDDTTSELANLLEQASQHEKAGMDVDSVQQQLEIAQQAQEDADGLLEQAQDAVDSEDVAAAAKAAQEAQKLQAKVEAALDQARNIVGASAKQAMETAVPDEVIAFDGWAKKLLGAK